MGLGRLESAPEVTGDWVEETATGNSFVIAANEPMRFFRLVGGGSTGPEVAGAPITSPFSNVVTVP